MPGINKLLARLTGNTPATTKQFTKDDAAAMLHVSKSAMDAFETSYQKNILNAPADTQNLFAINAKQAAKMQTQGGLSKTAEEITNNIVAELLEQTVILDYDGHELKRIKFQPDTPPALIPTSAIDRLPAEMRPQLTGRHMKRDMPQETYLTLLENYKKYQDSKNPKDKALWYNMFRQGLDILDLDPVTYQMLGMNMNSMGNWLPELVNGVQNQDFFKIPKTKIMKVPLTLLQLTRQEYRDLTPATMKILNDFCFKAFELNENQDYFIKTGTYSSKFDFRNAHVHGPKEVRELGQYLLFIHYQANMMAGPLTQPCIYGVSTTNEWVVREYIPDTCNLPNIYKGLPLRTEYRVFVDFDERTILGANPYWDAETMLRRFGHKSDADSPHQIHDYIVYKSQAERLQTTYDENIDMLREKLAAMLPNINLPGQWSIDIMQDGNTFYIIDMATAQTSAFNECIPPHLRKTMPENWIPKLTK